MFVVVSSVSITSSKAFAYRVCNASRIGLVLKASSIISSQPSHSVSPGILGDSRRASRKPFSQSLEGLIELVVTQCYCETAELR
jgi:hypothetical protein